MAARRRPPWSSSTDTERTWDLGALLAGVTDDNVHPAWETGAVSAADVEPEGTTGETVFYVPDRGDIVLLSFAPGAGRRDGRAPPGRRAVAPSLQRPRRPGPLLPRRHRGQGLSLRSAPAGRPSRPGRHSRRPGRELRLAGPPRRAGLLHPPAAVAEVLGEAPGPPRISKVLELRRAQVPTIVRIQGQHNLVRRHDGGWTKGIFSNLGRPSPPTSTATSARASCGSGTSASRSTVSTARPRPASSPIRPSSTAGSTRSSTQHDRDPRPNRKKGAGNAPYTARLEYRSDRRARHPGDRRRRDLGLATRPSSQGPLGQRRGHSRDRTAKPDIRCQGGIRSAGEDRKDPPLRLPKSVRCGPLWYRRSLL
ncbi:MAG: hypothetical protein MZV64_49940 [Ignavibacteriales bacterium]|nr:hypothetical protein [Ignavibacteriales bacterium]